MTTVQLFLLSCLAICPIVILFGPILIRIFKTKEFNPSRDAISTLRDFDSTKVEFLVWINLYMISQLVFTFLILPFLITVPPIIYALGLGSIICGVVSFVFLSTTYKHMYLISISFIMTILSMFVLSFYAYFIDPTFAMMTFLLGLVMLSFLAISAMNRMRLWLAEYIALGCLCIWNLITLFKLV